MAKLTLADVANIGGNPTSAANVINNNNQLIEGALENTLSRDGSTPNQMLVDLDMNGNDLINVGNVDADDITIDGTSLSTQVDAAAQSAQDASNSAIAAQGSASDASVSASAALDAQIAAEAALDATEDLVDDFGTAAYEDVGFFATAAQGAKADAADDLLKQEIDISQYGASPLSSDNTAAFLAAATAARTQGKKLVARLSGTYSLVTPAEINLRNLNVDFNSITIRVAHSGVGLVLGGNSGVGEAPDQNLWDVRRTGGKTSVPTVRIAGSKNQNISIDRSDYIQLYADSDSGSQSPYASGSIGYCIFDINHTELLELATNDATDGTLEQWINENTFHLARVYEIRIKGTYQHNHNSFHGGTIEQSPRTIDIQTGNSNHFYGIRMEGASHTINFGPGTRNNRIERTWTSSNVQNPEEGISGGTITDLGSNNEVYGKFAADSQYETVAYADISDVVLNNEAGEITNRTPQLQKVYGPSGNQPVMRSAMLPVVNGEWFFWGLLGMPGDSNLYRPFVEYFDANLVPITATNDMFVFSGFTPIAGNNRLSPSAGRNSAWGYQSLTIESVAKFCRVGWLISSAQQANALAKALWVRRANIPQSPTGNIGGTISRVVRTKVVSAAPSQGFAPVGYEAVRSDASARYVCTFALDTSLSSGGTASSTSIVVASGTGVTIGDIIGVNLDDRTTHWTTVSSVSGTTIGLTAGLPSVSANGSRVVFNRWV